MSRSQRFMGGLIFTYGYQAVVMLAGIWLTPFVLGRIGQHDFGLWLLGAQLLIYLTLTDFGVVELLPLETAYETGRQGGSGSVGELPQIVGQTIRTVLSQLPVVALLAGLMWLFIPAAWQGLKGPLGVVFLAFVVAFPLRIMPALLKGLQELAFVSGAQMLGWLMTTAVTVGLVLAGWGLYALAAGWLVGQLALAPVFAYRLWTRHREVVPRRLPPFSWAKSRAQLGKGSWVSLSSASQLLMGSTDLLVIGKLLGPAAAVPYACTGKLLSVLANQAQLMMEMASPGLAELKTAESRQSMLRVLTALTHGVLSFSGLVFCVTVVVNHWFVNWWVSSQQYGGLALTVVFVCTIPIRHWTTVTAYSVFCFGHQRRISLTNFCDGLVTTASCIVLTMAFGLPGAAGGTILGAALVSLPCNLRVIARETGVTVWRLISDMLGAWIWRFAIIGGVVLLVSLRWSPKNLLEAAAASIVVTAVYLLIMLPNVLRSPLGEYLRAFAASFRAKYAALQVRLSS